MDAKLRRVRLKYGMEGYGLYWYCLELVAQNVEQHNLTFELEHDSELIAVDTGIHYELVQEMMVFMVDLGLFEQTDGMVTCLKLAKRTDEYTRKLINKLPDVRTLSGHTPDKVRSIRIEEKRREDKTLGRDHSTDFETFWEAYPKKRKKKTSREIWMRKKPDLEKLIADVAHRMKKDRRWVEGFVPDPTTYLNQERWNDEVEPIDLKVGVKSTADWAADLGLHQNPGEEDDMFERRVANAVTAKMYGIGDRDE